MKKKKQQRKSILFTHQIVKNLKSNLKAVYKMMESGSFPVAKESTGQ